MKRAIILGACLMVLGACGGSDDTNTDEAAERATSTTAAPTTSAAASTAADADTTTTPEVDVEEYFAGLKDREATCSAGWEGSEAQGMGIDSIDFNRLCGELTQPGSPGTAPAVAAVGDGFTISRDTALASNECIDAWIDLRSDGMIGSYYSDDLSAAKTSCEEATALLDVDNVSAPLAAVPSRSLAVLLSTINLKLSFEAVAEFSRSCPGGLCALTPDEQDDFMVLLELVDPGERLSAFADPRLVAVMRPDISDIEGLRVAS